MSTRRTVLRATASLLLLLAAGCSSSTAPTSQGMPTPQTAVVVNAPNGGSTTVFLKSPDGGDPIMLSTAGTDVCPECKAAAIKYFQTGVLDPKCSRTGATRSVVNYVGTTNVSHN